MIEAERHQIEEDEWSLLDLWQAMKRYKWLLLAAPILAVIVASVVAGRIKPVWEASALIQVGQLGQPEQKVEPASRTVARMTNPSFMFRVFGQLGLPVDEESPEVNIYRASFKARQLPGTDLIELKLRGPSNDTANKWILATVRQLRVDHDEMMKPGIDRMEQQLAEVEKAARDGQNMVNDLRKQLISGKVGSAQAVLYVMLIQQKMAELQELGQRKLALEEQAHPVRTFPTTLIGDVYVSKYPVSPNKRLILVTAMFLGLLGAVIIAYLHNSIGKGLGRETAVPE